MEAYKAHKLSVKIKMKIIAQKTAEYRDPDVHMYQPVGKAAEQLIALKE